MEGMEDDNVIGDSDISTSTEGLLGELGELGVGSLRGGKDSTGVIVTSGVVSDVGELIDGKVGVL